MEPEVVELGRWYYMMFHTIWAVAKGWQVGLHVGITRFGRLWAKRSANRDVRQSKRRVGESCGDCAEVSTSWKTEFPEVGNLAKYRFGFSKDLPYTL